MPSKEVSKTRVYLPITNKRISARIGEKNTESTAYMKMHITLTIPPTIWGTRISGVLWRKKRVHSRKAVPYLLKKIEIILLL